MLCCHLNYRRTHGEVRSHFDFFRILERNHLDAYRHSIPAPIQTLRRKDSGSTDALQYSSGATKSYIMSLQRQNICQGSSS